MTCTNKRKPLEEDTITRFEYPPPPDSEDPFDTPLPTPSSFESGPESTEVGPIKTGQKTEVQGPSRLAWTSTMEEGLFRTLLDKVRNGKRADSGFKQEAWVDALEKLKSKESNYKAYYKDWKWLIETSCVTEAPGAWDEVLRHRKSCKWHPIRHSMATGGYATTLINRPLDSPVLDPLLRAPSSSGGGSYQLIEKVITQLARSRRNVLQQAIDPLEDEYSRKLSSEHMDMALDCLENEAKSSMFTSIKDVARRDRWLERHAGHQK
ncbi:hypothetical protein V1522DRAFT_461035 [Lipomyces starkeyi]